MHTYLAANHKRNVKQHDTSDFKALLGQWERQVLNANNAFSNRQWLSTLALYNQAIALANQLIAISPYRKEATFSLLVSFHNLSDTYLQYASEAPSEERMAIYHMSLATLSEVQTRFDTQAMLLPDNTDVLRARRIAHQQRWLLLKQHPELENALNNPPTIDNSFTVFAATAGKVSH
ncbi:hypothetical protein R1T43_17920 [Alteromonas sp. CI.11.F.A3]|uniref:hypothetical protein n=1 Tax=Alteromonas sp. CI.11.F.A3 TaxID=3079555 RepID=UPI0029435071|nr:hypothetical protein [Alteromonas sp. CI.11.F.A3]WOI37046.1 hypothetical protein R1T43_17920 [Alteromonas sp. CI.11.F.A3]